MTQIQQILKLNETQREKSRSVFAISGLAGSGKSILARQPASSYRAALEFVGMPSLIHRVLVAGHQIGKGRPPMLTNIELYRAGSWNVINLAANKVLERLRLLQYFDAAQVGP